jgi:Tfp pilus assembly protein PilE
VIIGILAAIAIPKFAATKQKAYLAAMKADLRNLATAEEGYFADNTAYFTGTWTPGVTTNAYSPSAGVTIVVAAAGSGWSATAVHAQTPTNTCAIFYGTSTAVAPATVEKERKCQLDRDPKIGTNVRAAPRSGGRPCSFPDVARAHPIISRSGSPPIPTLAKSLSWLVEAPRPPPHHDGLKSYAATTSIYGAGVAYALLYSVPGRRSSNSRLDH